MYYIISVIIGCIIAGMIAINGGLSAQYGIYGATVIIHLVGTIFAIAVIKLRRMKLNLSRAIPVWLFSGGVIGVLTTVFNNFAFSKISMTSIVALGLFGQTLTSICIDSFGWFGMQKHRFSSSKLLGIAFAIIGILIMLDNTEIAALTAIILSLTAGVTIVLSRTVNARLSDRLGALQGSFINHLVGLPVTIAILFLFGRAEPIFTDFALSPAAWIYLGGVLGVIIVLLFNIIVPKMQSVYLTLLTFVGQVFTGIIIDIFTKQSYSASTFYGGILVAIGIFINLLLEYVQKRKTSLPCK
ncbi:MAG: DMT family transporter [Clostridia bacterium]